MDHEKNINKCLKEQQPANETESKFNVGDWIINNDKRIAIPIQILKIEKYGCAYSCGYTSFDKIKTDYHLWNIQDASDGDVIATENFIFIFKNIDNGNGVHYYCHYETSKHEDDNQFDIALPQSLMGIVGNSISNYSPATKEQRDLLFSKMKEAGYEWDAEKKELVKIENVSAWSEVDEIRLDEAILMVKANGNWVRSEDGVKLVSDWLKFLKGRVQPKPKQGEQKPILEVFGFKVGDTVRLKDGDGRKHIIKSFEEIKGLHGPNFYNVEFEDNSARDGIYPDEKHPNGYYTQMEKFEIEQKPAWSEENSCYYDDICEILINLINSPKSKINKDAIQKDLDWLMSIEKSQLKATWNEEDEAIL